MSVDPFRGNSHLETYLNLLTDWRACAHRGKNLFITASKGSLQGSKTSYSKGCFVCASHTVHTCILVNKGKEEKPYCEFKSSPAAPQSRHSRAGWTHLCSHRLTAWSLGLVSPPSVEVLFPRQLFRSWTLTVLLRKSAKLFSFREGISRESKVVTKCIWKNWFPGPVYTTCSGFMHFVCLFFCIKQQVLFGSWCHFWLCAEPWSQGCVVSQPLCGFVAKGRSCSMPTELPFSLLPFHDDSECGACCTWKEKLTSTETD